MEEYDLALRSLIHAGKADAGVIMSVLLNLDDAVGGYTSFDDRLDDWPKVVLHP